MILTTTCCLNGRPPTAPLAAAQPPPSARPKWEKSWKKQCAVGLACVIIGLEIEGIVDYAIAMEPKAAIDSQVKGKRWSDKRICPAWQLNSLETIVPENLPRPSSKRPWEAVGDHSKLAPPVKASTTTTATAISSCFSM